MIAAPSEWFSSAQDQTAQEVVEGLSRQAHAEDLPALSFSMKAALVAASDEWVGQGYASPIEWVRRDCRMTAGAATVYSYTYGRCKSDASPSRRA